MLDIDGQWQSKITHFHYFVSFFSVLIAGDSVSVVEGIER